MKACFKCLAVKPLADFYVHPQMGDGHLNKCKACAKRDVRANYAKTRGARSQYERSRTATPERRAAKQEYQLARRAAQPEKYKARTAVGNAVRDGRLAKPTACQKCGRTGRIEAHHADYSKPLCVEWLCFQCHRSEEHGQVVSAVDF